ncbi:hypothetical protein SAMN05421852_12422 [Thermoflavimicrobium dichotomicum]|uniref:Uncharacterized protein n=1 Tax=Thermoflavimicrobium dichotomicum TaxID=46223 RepID=A0A1I3UDM0_9BACL|nr:hypothetical protein SAMN05421852_12422 [Thermoflavimicrobium dichotomicum]
MPKWITERIASLDWDLLQQLLDEYGYALIPHNHFGYEV